MKNYCYIISSHDKTRTYNGYTNNLTRRLRQHCGEISGGARSTQCRDDWEYIAILTSESLEFTKNIALSCEWHIRYPTNKKPRPRIFNGYEGRLKSLEFALHNIQNKYTTISFVLYIPNDIYQFFQFLQNEKLSIKLLSELL